MVTGINLMEKPITLAHFYGIEERPLIIAETLIKKAPLSLLPLLINHKNGYVNWAVRRRLSSKGKFSIEAFIRENRTHKGYGT